MKKLFILVFIALNIVYPQQKVLESQAEKDARMQWWREARFGMFIHWGLYSVPAGEWNGQTTHAEWIRTTAEIPLEVYDKFIHQFNPEKFDADNWVKMAKDAGMKYIVITSKHHDGFGLFDSKFTDFDIMSTPFKRDILKELADACRKNDMRICFYHSIMDWHHPDYIPRRGWETSRSTEGADFSRFIEYLKNQLKEIITNYGDIGVLWFDGEWEDTWTKQLGDELYNYVRSLDQKIIVNNRVSKGRAGMEGLTIEGGGAGDFGTPEQQVPATGFPGVDWESCITMNDNWGYNKHDKNFKSTEYILQMIADIASKGGNLLLNIGPKADGTFPEESVVRLKEIGEWMHLNSESIYSTKASPFKSIPWGRCTQKQIDGDTRLYLHVFDWPEDGKLFLPGIVNNPKSAFLLSDKTALKAGRIDNGILIDVPMDAPDNNNSVVVLDIQGTPDVISAPVIKSDNNIFIKDLQVVIESDSKSAELRYSLDGTIPTNSSPLYTGVFTIDNTSRICAALFQNGKMVSDITRAEYTKVQPQSPANVKAHGNGIEYKYFEGEWNTLPDYSAMKPVKSGIAENFSLAAKQRTDHYGFEFNAYIKIPADGVYTFYIDSDDGSKLYINNSALIDNDGLHDMIERKGVIALKAGFYPIRVAYFENTGGDNIIVSFRGPGIEKQQIPSSYLFYLK